MTEIILKMLIVTLAILFGLFLIFRDGPGDPHPH